MDAGLLDHGPRPQQELGAQEAAARHIPVWHAVVNLPATTVAQSLCTVPLKAELKVFALQAVPCDQVLRLDRRVARHVRGLLLRAPNGARSGYGLSATPCTLALCHMHDARCTMHDAQTSLMTLVSMIWSNPLRWCPRLWRSCVRALVTEPPVLRSPQGHVSILPGNGRTAR